jgi:hypothetical protein
MPISWCWGCDGVPLPWCLVWAEKTPRSSVFSSSFDAVEHWVSFMINGTGGIVVSL